MTMRSDCLDNPAIAAPGRVGRFFTTLLVRFSEWQERAQQRAHLACMDERMLKDIGINQVDAAREATKPFWRA